MRPCPRLRRWAMIAFVTTVSPIFSCWLPPSCVQHRWLCCNPVLVDSADRRPASGRHAPQVHHTSSWRFLFGSAGNCHRTWSEFSRSQFRDRFPDGGCRDHAEECERFFVSKTVMNQFFRCRRFFLPIEQHKLWVWPLKQSTESNFSPGRFVNLTRSAVDSGWKWLREKLYTQTQHWQPYVQRLTISHNFNFTNLGITNPNMDSPHRFVRDIDTPFNLFWLDNTQCRVVPRLKWCGGQTSDKRVDKIFLRH